MRLGSGIESHAKPPRNYGNLILEINLEQKEIMEATMRRLADFGIVLLITLAIGLPLYIKWSGSKLSCTPEPELSKFGNKTNGIAEE